VFYFKPFNTFQAPWHGGIDLTGFVMQGFDTESFLSEQATQPPGEVPESLRSRDFALLKVQLWLNDVHSVASTMFWIFFF